MRSDIEQCAALVRNGSHTFHAASLIMPCRYREAAFAVYGFCRTADDAIDGGNDAARALERMRGRLDQIYRGCPIVSPVDRAFATVVERLAIPRALPDALLEGFAWDVENRRYQTLDDLVAYAVRVAGTVGAMMALLMGQRDPAVVARAIELGVAMQLTNIARDVGEDARAGRLYLPQQWMHTAGLDPNRFVARPEFNGQIGRVICQLLRAAGLLYEQAEAGIVHLPATCRPAIATACVLYAEIGRQVERNNFDSVSQRAVVPLSRKLLCVACASAKALAVARDLAVPPLPQARFLIDAVVAGTSRSFRSPVDVQIPWWRFRERGIRVIELFERLERSQRLKQANW
jgi:15-cis-phytoene synthase